MEREVGGEGSLIKTAPGTTVAGTPCRIAPPSGQHPDMPGASRLGGLCLQLPRFTRSSPSERHTDGPQRQREEDGHSWVHTYVHLLCWAQGYHQGDLVSLHSPQGKYSFLLPGAGAQGTSTAVTDTAPAWDNLGLCPGCSTPSVLWEESLQAFEPQFPPPQN